MRSYIYIIILLASLGASAQPMTLTLEQCRELAAGNNHKLQGAEWKIRQAQAETANYKANFFPKIELTGLGLLSTNSGSYSTPDLQLPVFLGADMSQGPMGFAFVPSMTIDYNIHQMWQAGVSLTQPIYMGGKIKAGYDIARLSTDLARLNLQKTRDDILLESDEAYMTAVKCLMLNGVADAYKELIDNLMRNVESAHAHGMKTRADVARARVALGDAELMQAKASNGYRLAVMNLCHVAGLDLDTQITLADTLPPAVTAADYIPCSTPEGRPEYEMLELQARIADRQVAVAKADMLPQVGVTVEYGLLHGLEVMGDPMFDKKFGLNGLLSVRIPLYSFGQNPAKARSARAKAEQARAEQAELNEKMTLEITQRANQLNEAMLEAEIAERNLEYAAECLRVSQCQYEAGMETLNDLLEANLLWLQASQKRVETRYGAYIALARYNRACGR